VLQYDMHRSMLTATLLTVHTCASLHQPQRQPSIRRRAATTPALAFLAALAVQPVQPAAAIPPPEGCVWTGEG